MSDDLSVADLVTHARNGNRQAWDVLVERFAPLIWSICRRHQLVDTDANDVGRNVWLQLVQELDMIHDPAALPGWLATATRRECGRILRAAREPQLTGYVPDATILPDQKSSAAEREPLVAQRHAALRAAFTGLPPRCQALIALLIENPPVPYAEISTRLNIPVKSIEPNRSRCLDRLRRHPAIATLINAQTESRDLPGQLCSNVDRNATEDPVPRASKGPN
jgi:RNA polymerase sigma factor (sigma-70 family)